MIVLFTERNDFQAQLVVQKYPECNDPELLVELALEMPNVRPLQPMLRRPLGITYGGNGDGRNVNGSFCA